jgi:hypothetical protein
MIDFNIHKDILRIEDLRLESNLSSLTSRDMGTIEAVRMLQVREKAYFQRDMLSIFRNFLSFCLQEHNVYLVLLEPYPQTQTSIRSKKGLLYKHRGAFEERAVFETEIEVSPRETLFAALARITEKDIDRFFNRFDDLPFALGLITPRNKKTFRTSRKDFLETIVSEGLKPGAIYWKNWLKLAAILTQPGRKFFSLQELNDTEYFRVFYHEADAAWGNSLERFISQELQTSPILQN